MSDTFLRYLLLLQEMPHSPRQTDTATLALRLEERGFRVTRRTLQRDLEKLSRVLPIVCADTSKPYGWSWKPGSSSPLPAAAGAHGPARADAGTLSETVLATLDRWLSLGDGRFESGLSPFIVAHLPDTVAAHTGLLVSDLVIPLPLTDRNPRGVGLESSFVLSSVDQQTVLLVRLRARPPEPGLADHERDPELEAQALSTVGLPGAQLRVVLVEPAPAPGRDSIGFDELAFVVERDADVQGRCLARHLRRWAAMAGAPVREAHQGKMADVIPLAARARLAVR